MFRLTAICAAVACLAAPVFGESIALRDDAAQSMARQEALFVLARSGAAESLTMLVNALEDPDWGVKHTAAMLLHDYGTPEARAAYERAVDAVFASALRSSESELRAIAARTIGRAGSAAERHAEALCTIRTDDQLQVRLAAIWALGAATSEAASRCLASAAADQLWDVRQMAARALGRAAVPERLKLLERLSRDAFPPVRWDAMLALKIYGDDALGLLKQGCQDSDPSVQTAAQAVLRERRTGCGRLLGK